jgi:transcriptional regulator of heat shock response
MVTSKRQNLILNKIVGEYIMSAQPVSSKKIVKKYRLGVSPATIRNEMQKLTEEGFLYQPHTSAGRVPTDKGYRFFVDDLLERNFFDLEPILKIEEMIKEERENVLRLAARLTKMLAEESSNFAVLNLLERDFLWKEGWEEILQEPEFRIGNCVSNFTIFLKNLEEGIEKLGLNSGIRVYIGKESPFPKSKEFSVIISQYYWPKEEKGIISLLGPKRMAYDRNIALIKSFKETLENW